METIAQDSNKIPRFLLVDADGKLILGAGAIAIGEVKITDGTETADVDANNQLRVTTAGVGKTPITKSASSGTGGSTTLYTVPGGKTFYLQAVWLNAFALAANTTAIIHSGAAENSSTRILRIDVGFNAAMTNMLAGQLNFTVPLEYAAGSVFRLFLSDSADEANGGIIGWEE